jgi:hypothetical protein
MFLPLADRTAPTTAPVGGLAAHGTARGRGGVTPPLLTYPDVVRPSEDARPGNGPGGFTTRPSAVQVRVGTT